MQLLSRAIGEHIYHPAGDHARLRNAIMSAKSQEDWYGDLAWIYGGTGLRGEERSALSSAVMPGEAPSASSMP